MNLGGNKRDTARFITVHVNIFLYFCIGLPAFSACSLQWLLG